MTDNEKLEGNCLIAEYLEWIKSEDSEGKISFAFAKLDEPIKYDFVITPSFSGCLKKNGKPYDKDTWYEKIYDYNLSFDSDSNLQWLVLEKIAKEALDDTIDNTINRISYPEKIRTKQDLFEALVNYIKNK